MSNEDLTLQLGSIIRINASGNGDLDSHIFFIKYIDGKLIKLIDDSTLEEKQLNIEGIFIQIGLVPNTDWVNGAIDLSKYGEIEINNNGATSLPGVFAAGDVTTVPYKQIIIAMGEGSKAALGAFDYLIRH